MDKIKCRSSFYLRESVAPQAFYIKNQEIYYFDKNNKYEGRFCLKDNCGERVLFQINDGYGIFDNRGDMYILNLDMYSGTTKYSKRNGTLADCEMKGIYYDIKSDEDGNLIFLGNDDGRTIIKLSDGLYNEKRVITPKGIIFGSSIYVHGENIFLGAVGEDDRLKILKLNYIGGILDSYDIHIRSKNRIIGKIDMIDNYLILLISGKKESIVVYDLVSKKTNEVFISQIGLTNVFDICIDNKSVAVLSERRIFEFELSEFFIREIYSPAVPLRINPDTYLYLKMLYCIELYESIYRYMYISLFISILEYMILSVFGILDPLRIPEGVMFITIMALVVNCCAGMIFTIINLGKKYKRIEKLIYIFNKEYSKCGLIITSILNSCAAAVLVYLLLFPRASPEISLFVGIVIFAADIYVNAVAKRRITLLKNDVIIELLEDDDIQVKKYIKDLSESMNRNNINTLRVNITSDKDIDSDIGILWLNSRRFILKNEIQWIVSENHMTAMLDLSTRDIKYSKYNIIMDFICYMRIKTRVKELKIEIVDKLPGGNTYL